ncbi:hypothetical protein G6R29_02125 [Fructobacillus sp. M2-14]|uniref:Integral membrane protein n=1 Tax=Fructobacillus broussonetiae TaxID=2713173 RepID=A0ABS5QZ14_9LACO|nr:hypothetical protein [Fructobacillus broussonetiae]MBS9338434.1 hypothetical protein [Fructobacillus broussonetiae]
MVWYFWAAIWLAVLLFIMIWRFLYRAFPAVTFMDLATLPTWFFLNEIEGAAFYRSDVLLLIVILLIWGGVWSFLTLDKNDLKITDFIHRFWQISGMVASGFAILTILMAIFFAK